MKREQNNPQKIALPPKYPVWDEKLKLFRPYEEFKKPCKKVYVVHTVELLQTDE
jgi:hypothetical protein